MPLTETFLLRAGVMPGWPIKLKLKRAWMNVMVRGGTPFIAARSPQSTRRRVIELAGGQRSHPKRWPHDDDLEIDALARKEALRLAKIIGNKCQ